MNERVKADGFESAVVKSWSGWDGDQEMMQFYDPEFQCDIPGVVESDKVYERYTVCFMLDSSRVAIYNDKGESVFSRKFKLCLTSSEASV